MLFGERARAHDPEFELDAGNATAVAEICRRVDGLPLAIELAAARCDLLSPHEIAERLDASFAALARGPRDAPARQRSLRATLDWSHDLLTSRERACFSSFAVFAGGATIAAAEAITGADLETLDRLVAKNLLVRSEHAHQRTRLRMLETVRAYAGERFASAADRRTIEERHFHYYRALADRHGTDRALWSGERKQHLVELDADIDNSDAAVRWALETHNPEYALAIVAAHGRYWHVRNRYAHAAHWIEQALNLPGSDRYPTLRVRALCALVWALWPLGRAADQPAAIAAAKTIAREPRRPAASLPGAAATRRTRDRRIRSPAQRPGRGTCR